jgi:Tol biopolymer transport system component
MRRSLAVLMSLSILLLVTPTPAPAQTSDQLGEFLFTTDSIVFAVNHDGSDRRELFPSSGFGYDGDAAWSPDGLFVAFNSYSGGDGGAALFIGDPRGQSVRRLTATGTLRLYTTPAWAPDGSRLVFVASALADDDAQRALYVVNRDGSGLHILNDQAPEGVVLDAPIWSPDGTQILFMERDYVQPYGGGKPTRIMIMDADGSNVRQLFEIESYIKRIAWSPDGSQLAFLADFESFKGMDSVPSLYIANLDGSDLHSIPAHEPKSPPVWSPDGNFIAYAGYASQDQRGIFITNVAGTSERLVPDSYGTDQIDWTAGAVESQITGIQVTNRNLSTVIDSDEYVLDNCGSPAQRTDSWQIEHQLTRSISFGTDTTGGTETTTCNGTNHTATWDVGGEIGPIKEIINISGGYSDSTEETSQTCTAVLNQLTTAYRLDQESSVTESRQFSVELPPNEIVKYEITVYEVAVQGYVTVARTNGFYSDQVQIPFVLHDRIRIDARPVPATCPTSSDGS